MSNDFQFNPVFDGLEPSSTLHINEAVNSLWRQGEQVFHMGFGESRFAVNAELQTALQDNSHQKSYLPARGLPELADAIASYYSTKLDVPFLAHQVMVGPGSKALIYGLQMVLAADIFLPTPSWVSYAPQASLLGNQAFYIPSTPENNYQFEISALDKLVKGSSARHKMLIINSPNNPSGQMLSDDFLQQLADYCRANEVLVLSDEIYFQVCHGDVEHVSISKYYPEGTFVLGGLSKHLSIGGWRLGVALLPDTEFGEAIMSKMAVLASETWSGVSSPIQYAAIKAYSLEPAIERYIADCTDIHGIRTRFCRQALVDMGIRCSRAEGAFYITVNFDKYRGQLAQMRISTSKQLAEHLLSEYRIASLPGSDFGIPLNTHTLRLSTSYLDMETEFDSQRIYDLYNGGLGSKTLMTVENHPTTHAALAAFAQFIKTIETLTRTN